MPMPIEFSSRATRDLDQLTSNDRARVLAALAAIDAPNADVRPLQGRPRWRRLRAGDQRVLLHPTPRGTLLVKRIVNRRDLERVLRGL